jgi:Sec-independent protein translocase protein TatA
LVIIAGSALIIIFVIAVVLLARKRRSEDAKDRASSPNPVRDDGHSSGSQSLLLGNKQSTPFTRQPVREAWDSEQYATSASSARPSRWDATQYSAPPGNGTSLVPQRTSM